MTRSEETYASRRRAERMGEDRIPESEKRGSLVTGILFGLAVFAFLLVGSVAAMKAFYLGRVYPGVSVAGVELSGLTRAKAKELLQSRVTFPTLGTVTLVAGEERWQKSPAQLGLGFQVNESVEAAYAYGRDGNLIYQVFDILNAAQAGVNIPPIITINEQVSNRELSAIDQYVLNAPREAELRIEGLDVIYTPGQAGKRIDFEPTKAYLAATMQLFVDSESPVVIRDVMPSVLNAEDTANKARQVLSQPFTLAIPNAAYGDPGPWVIEPEQLAPMLRFVRKIINGTDTYVLSIDADSIKSVLNPLIGQIDRPENDGRFAFDESTGQISMMVPSSAGYQLNISDSIALIDQALENGQNSSPLGIQVTKPLVANDVTAEQLGITQLTASETTYFWGSSTERRQNIRTAAENFDGILVPPNSVFSMGKYMSDVTLENGYAEALIIYNGQTIKGVGGGVCQVSTTLFRTAFYAGMPINERNAHAYRVSAYEQTPGGSLDPFLAGFDATVYFPLVDMKFTNNSPYWILMRTFYDDAYSSLTWNFYSTPDGRDVSADFSGPKDVIPPLDPVIRLNEELAPGEIRRVDYPAEGASVVIERMVTMANGEQMIDTFKTEYQPWAEVCEYGPDVDNLEKMLKNRGWCQPVSNE